MKDWTIEVYLLKGEQSSWWLLIESLKMTCARSCVWFLNFLSNGEGLDYFSWPNAFRKVSKITVTYSKLVKWRIRVNSDFPKVWLTLRKSELTLILTSPKSSPVSKITSFKISSHGEARGIKFGQQVHLIQGVPLGTLPQ